MCTACVGRIIEIQHEAPSGEADRPWIPCRSPDSPRWDRIDSDIIELFETSLRKVFEMHPVPMNVSMVRVRHLHSSLRIQHAGSRSPSWSCQDGGNSDAACVWPLQNAKIVRLGWLHRCKTVCLEVNCLCACQVQTTVPLTGKCAYMQVNDAMLKEDRRWLSDRQRLNATFSMFIKRMESLVRHCSKWLMP